MAATELFSKADCDQIVAAIQQAEGETSGEIRVVVEYKAKKDVVERAKEVFLELEMHRTALANGTLIYLAVQERQYAILGDKGIDAVVPAGFWDGVRDIIGNNFKQSNFVQGIKEGVAAVGVKLKQYFPHQPDDINELPDEVIVR